MDCIFCKISNGEIDSAKIWEDDDIFVFLDINPITYGHALVIPKKHFEGIADIEADILKKLIVATKHIAGNIKQTLNADGIRLSQSNGVSAGQVVMHFHLHIIPRYENDGLSRKILDGNALETQINMDELKKLAEKIMQ